MRGDFNEPEYLVPVLYGAPYLRTCLLEFILPWAGAPGASPLAIIPEPTDGDEAADATRDRELAASPRRLPPFLYDRVAIRIRAKPVLRLLDLRDIAVRERLRIDDTISGALRFNGFSQLDRGAVFSPHRPLTRAIVGAVLRNSIFDPVDGLYVESRHSGETVVIFVGDRFEPKVEIVEMQQLSSAHAVINKIAKQIQLET